MKIAICENEEAFCIKLSKHIEKYFSESTFSIEELKIYLDGESLLHEYQEGKTFDILFLDIQLSPGPTALSGLDAAARIRPLDNQAAIVFLTSFHSYIYDAFSVEAIGFAEKPVDYETVCKMLDRCLSKYKTVHHEVVWKTDNGELVSLELNEIVFIESSGRNIRIYLAQSGKYIIVKKKISEIEKELQEWNFVRCHISYIINMSYFYSVDKDKKIINTKRLPMGNVETIPVSRRYLSEVKRVHAEMKK